MVCKRSQHVGLNNVASCWPTMLRAFARALRPCLQACKYVPFQVVEGLPYKPKYRANICYSLFYILILFLTLLLAVRIRSLFINYPTTAGTLTGQRQRQQNGEAFFRKHSWGAHFFPMFPSFQYSKHCFQCQLLFPRCKCLRYTKGNFKENPSIRAVAKILRARASDQFLASNSSKGQICEHFQIGWDHLIALGLDRG